MILFVNNNKGILFLGGIAVVVKRIIEYIRRASIVTTHIHKRGRITVDI